LLPPGPGGVRDSLLHRTRLSNRYLEWRRGGEIVSLALSVCFYCIQETQALLYSVIYWNCTRVNLCLLNKLDLYTVYFTSCQAYLHKLYLDDENKCLYMSTVFFIEGHLICSCILAGLEQLDRSIDAYVCLKSYIFILSIGKDWLTKRLLIT
jgi:hypothetical protein